MEEMTILKHVDGISTLEHQTTHSEANWSYNINKFCFNISRAFKVMEHLVA